MLILFQLTRSRGAWLKEHWLPISKRIFQLTRSRGAWRVAYVHAVIIWIFQLTRSRGAWLCWEYSPQGGKGISTHTLTWSVTFHLTLNFICRAISTHTLTWSVTLSLTACKNLRVTFQLTRSRGAWRNCNNYRPRYCHFNSHAHVERDSTCPVSALLLRQFQLTRSRGAWPSQVSPLLRVYKFQLTRSRGAWLLAGSHGEIFDFHFNSHAHVERDK